MWDRHVSKRIMASPKFGPAQMILGDVKGQGINLFVGSGKTEIRSNWVGFVWFILPHYV